MSDLWVIAIIFMFSVALLTPSKRRSKGRSKKRYQKKPQKGYQDRKAQNEWKVKKGLDYEKYISELYQKRGYTVWEHGIEKGYKDLGIDLVVKKDDEIVLIQCKNWNEYKKYKVTQKDIKAFRSSGRDFLDQNPYMKKYKLSLVMQLSGNFINTYAIEYIKQLQKEGKNISYEIQRMKKTMC